MNEPIKRFRCEIWWNADTFRTCKTLAEVTQMDAFLQREVADPILRMKP